ncbi:MAG: ribosome silencing factor [Lachnospiraceae bacterium]|nr:ribosome silencing factor [Lachnospiraceae bacterium]
MTKEESRALTDIVVKALNEKQAQDVKVIEISEISPLGDYFVIANGSNANQIQALVENVEEKGEKAGFQIDHVEGHRNANWTLIDFKGVIVHVFDEEAREHYDLERLWRDGSDVSAEFKEEENH